MKNVLFLLLFAVSLNAQIVDSTVIKQVDSLVRASRDLTEQEEFDKALEVNTLAESIALKKMGRESAAYGNCIHNNGRILYFKGDYPNSEKRYLEAKAIRAQAPGVGKEHPDYITTVRDLGNLYAGLGAYLKAEPLFLEVKDFLGSAHADYTSILSSLANLYADMANFEKAELYYLELNTLLEKAPGKQHPRYAGNLVNLATIYTDMGNFEKAESWFLEAKGILENLPNGREHVNYVNCINNLANLYFHMGKYEKAEPLYLEVMAIQEKKHGKEHPYYARCLDNLAIIEQSIGNYEKAEPLYLEALAIREKTLGKVNPMYANNLNNLALLYSETGKFEKAEPLHLEAKDIREKTLGKEHPDYATSVYNLAKHYQAAGEHQKAGAFFAEDVTAQRSLLSKAVRHLSEQEIGNYLSLYSGSRDELLAFAHSVPDESLRQKSAALCFDNALFYKGFLLQAAAQVGRLALSDAAAAEKFDLLKSCESRLAAQYAQPIAERDSTGIAVLETQTNDLEKDLARTVAGFGQAIRQVNWQEVQSALRPGEAAIEFVHFKFSEKEVAVREMYAALVLKPGNDNTVFIPLFEEKSLDSLLKTSGARKSDYVNGLYSFEKKGSKLVKTLFELVWQPLEKELTGVKTIYFSPSGLLHRVNLAAIPISEDETLADRFNFVELGSTRQLVTPSILEKTNSEAVLFGGIQYEMDSTAIAAANFSFEKNDLASRGEAFDFSKTDSTARGGSWAFLNYTEKEVDTLAPILTKSGLKPETRKGFAATEEAFKNVGKTGISPRVLHIATHGYFFPNPKSSTKNDAADPVFKTSDHPMIRSGLILAGGNQAWKTGKPFKPGMEDGILTAYEISQMNLANTELVVLSACETGLGDIQGNEGVYGLQRAFKIAGAKNLIMSLWQVPDFQTQELMTAFYQNWLSDKMEIPVAFRAAQKEMREKYQHPYFWAGFVLVE